jgi:hypothetical protein
LASAIDREELETAGGQKNKEDTVSHAHENRLDKTRVQLGRPLAPFSAGGVLIGPLQTDDYNVSVLDE